MGWASLLGGFFFGLAAGFIFFYRHTFSFSNTITSADVLNWAIVLIVATILQSYWQRNYSDRRIEKNLLIDQVKEVLTVLRDVRALFTTCYGKARVSEDDKRAMLGLLKNLSNGINFLEKALRRHKGRFRGVDLQEAKVYYLDYKRVLTGRNFPSRPYSGELYNEQEDAYRALRERFQETMFQINEG